MPSFSTLERKLSTLLDSYPMLKGLAKRIFQRINYLFFGNRRFKFKLNSKVTINDNINWANLKPQHTSRLNEFFGYYDKSPWSPDMRYIISHRLISDNKLQVILYDSSDNTEIILGTTAAWNFQQGAMAQWLPGEDHAIIFNDIDNNHLISRIIWLSGKELWCPWPIQIIHPSGKTALTINYKRLFKIRPEYGYAGKVVNFSCSQALDEDGIWSVDLVSGKRNLILRLYDLIEFRPKQEIQEANHKINHLLFSPSGERFVFMHRWLVKNGKFSRLYVANETGKDLKLLMDERMVSHYSWQDDHHVLAWCRTKEYGDRYYLINILTGRYDIIGEGALDSFGDGHPSFSPDRRWIITDTYPDRARQRHLFLYEMATGRLIEVGSFFSPFKYDGPNRCDLHPRWSPDGKLISIDSSHTGIRKSYILDVSEIVV